MNKLKTTNSNITDKNIIKILLENRGLTDKKAIQEFLNPKMESITVDSVGIDKKQLKKAMERIMEAVKNQEQIIIYGDYDVDGITGAAILWETLYHMKAKAMPFLPDRVEEGYGLSIKGIEKILSTIPEIKLIITVDNGIVANEAVKFANEKGIDVIITDHHVLPSGADAKLPESLAIVHTTKMCGAGIAWLIAQKFKELDGKYDYDYDEHLELATLGTVADMVPLTGDNRTLVKFGLEKLPRTRRVGLLSLFTLSGLKNNSLGVYEIGYIIGPRLNASGRIENAMDSLRLLCTKDKNKGRMLAEKLELANRERQLLTKEATEHASLSIKMGDSLKKILIVSHESYQQGVIGLVAGKLVEEFYRPSIVVSIGEKYSKASARSVDGFNMIEFLRSSSEYFVNVGGHPMAAGFTIETEKIITLKESLETTAEELLDTNTLTKSLKIDCELPLSIITTEFYKSIQQLSPFGMNNPQPVFVTRGVIIEDLRVLGRDANHLKLRLSHPDSELPTHNPEPFEAIAFNMGGMAKEIKIGEKIDLAYTIDENTWNGNTKLQLKVKDIKISN